MPTQDTFHLHEKNNTDDNLTYTQKRNYELVPTIKLNEHSVHVLTMQSGAATRVLENGIHSKNKSHI